MNRFAYAFLKIHKERLANDADHGGLMIRKHECSPATNHFIPDNALSSHCPSSRIHSEEGMLFSLRG
jgi:hypothetical protein